MASVSCSAAPAGKAIAGSAKVVSWIALAGASIGPYPFLSHTDVPHPEFWSNRLAATDPPLDASQTQIPFIPDQTQFLERWFEFHQGFRIVKHPDGSESRIAVHGEPFREVSPGFLPRTLHELRQRTENDASRPQNRFARSLLATETECEQTPHETIEDALDNLLADISDDEAQPAEQREQQDMPRQSTALSRRLSRGQVQLQRARDRFARIFGTREDVQRDDYESPISSMYDRAWNRYQQAEERRASGQTMAPSTDGLSQHERQEVEQQLLWGVMNESRAALNPALSEPAQSEPFQSQSNPEPNPPGLHESSGFSSSGYISRLASRLSIPDSPPSTDGLLRSTTSDLTEALSQLTADLARLRQASDSVASARSALQQDRQPSPPPSESLDVPHRPPPLSEEQMTKNLACHVCYSQLADIAVLPCGHMVMCQWCADIVVPVKHAQFPARPSKCPMCRKGIKQRLKIHLAS